MIDFKCSGHTSEIISYIIFLQCNNEKPKCGFPEEGLAEVQMYIAISFYVGPIKHALKSHLGISANDSKHMCGTDFITRTC